MSEKKMDWRNAPLAGAGEGPDAIQMSPRQKEERKVGLAQRTAIEGITQGVFGIPAFAGDVLFGAAPSLLTQAFGGEPYTGSRLTPFSSSVRYAGESLADLLGKPKPETEAEKTAVRYGTTGIAALGGAGVATLASRLLPRVVSAPPVSGDLLRPNVIAPAERSRVAAAELGAAPTAQTGASLGGELGGDIGVLAAGDDADQKRSAAFRTGGSILGTFLGGSTAGVSSAAGSTASQPFTAPGRDISVGSLLRNMATNPDQAILNLQRSRANVPGVQPLTADSARDIGLAGFETGVRSSADMTNLIAAQRLANARVLRQEMDRLARTSDPAERDAVIKKMQDIRSEMTRPMREQALASMDANISPELAQRGISLSIDDVLKKIKSSERGAGEGAGAVINWTRGRLNDEILGKDVEGNFFKRLYEIRKDLREKTLASTTEEQTRVFKSGAPVAEDIIRAIDDILDSAAGGNKSWQSYLENFAESSRRQERIGLLQDIQQRSIGTTADIESGRFMLSAPAMTRIIRSRQSEINDTLTSVQQKRLNNILLDLQQGSAPSAPGARPPTSGTIKNITMANLIGRTLGGQASNSAALRTLIKPLEWLTNVPEEKAQELLVQAMIDPKLAALLMQKADPKNVTTFSDSLRESARGSIYATPRSGLLGQGE